jgi:peptidoglycan/LPS O-acetylase OafA/YrhL
MVKGWAILGVTLIHSQALEGSSWMSLLFFHSVPVLIVVFGMNAEQWFRARPPRGRILAWYRRALRRIAVPVWTALALWWAMVLVLQPPFLRPTPRLLALHALGIPRHVGTGWFIAVLVQLVVAFPLIRVGLERWGKRSVLVVALAVTVGLIAWEQDLRQLLGRAGWTYLSPRFAAHVVFGWLLAEHVGRRDLRFVLLAAGALVALDVVVVTGVLPSPWGRVADRLSELPLTVVLLATATVLARFDVLAKVLGWLGRHSLGLYLGQLLTHGFFLFALGGTCSIYDCQGGVYEIVDPWAYTAILLAGSIAWMELGNAALRGLASLRARGLPVPDLSV